MIARLLTEGVNKAMIFLKLFKMKQIINQLYFDFNIYDKPTITLHLQIVFQQLI